jgi:hypothetical protein
MSDPVFVCPPKEPLLRALTGRQVVVDLPSLEGIVDAFGLAQRCGTQVRCVRVRFPGLLAEIKPEASWENIPLALYVNGVGKFRDVAPLLPELRKLNVRIYIPASSSDNLAGIRILSSLGLAAAAIIDRTADWAGCADLCTYALLGIARHASIEPFGRLAEQYDATGVNRLTSALFEDPAGTFHMSENGAVARTSDQLAKGEFVAQSIEQFLATPLPTPSDSALKLLAQNSSCAFCAALSVCLGTVADPAACPSEAKEFFADLLDAVEQSKDLSRRGRRMLWQT